MVSFIGMLTLVHPFATTWHFTHREACHWIRGSLLSPMNPVPLPPQGETRNLRRKIESHILHVPLRHPPLVAGATTFPPHWEACHWILSRLRLLANPVPLPPQFGGAAKGKRLNGQARRLTSPHLEVLCRTSTGDYKAPRSHVLISRSTLSTGCSASACGGSPAQPDRGRRAQRANLQNAYQAI